MHSLAILRPCPSPRSSTIPEGAVEQHRDVWCKHYDDCLDQACKRDWTSFSCATCPLMGLAQVKPELRVGGGALGDAPESATGGQWGRRQEPASEKRPPVAWLWGRLRGNARPIEDLCGPYSRCRTRETLRRFARQGIVEQLEDGTWRRSGMRRCRGCQQLLPREAFTQNPAAVDGLRSRCRQCIIGGRRA